MDKEGVKHDRLITSKMHIRIEHSLLKFSHYVLAELVPEVDYQ